jgi:hypothetical protein
MTTTKTLLIAGFAALSLGVGTAWADAPGGWGAAPDYYDQDSSVVTNQATPAPTQPVPAQGATGTFWTRSGAAISPTVDYDSTSRGD